MVCRRPVFQLYLQDQPIREYRDTWSADGGRWVSFCRAMTRLGIYLNGGKLYCSAAHTEADLVATLTATEEALAKIG